MFNINPWKETTNIAARDKHPLSSFQNEMNRLLSDFFDDSALLSAKGPDNKFLAPAIDITEDDAGYKITAELPGLSREDIDVDINKNYLTIKGEKQTSKEDEDKNFIRRERHFGSFQRTMALPETANIEKVEANFNQGVLQVNIPKQESAAATSVKVDIGEEAGAEAETKPKAE